MMDHAIPLTIIVKMMFEDKNIRTVDSIHAFLRKFYRLGILTYEENAFLDKLGLRSKMPNSWNQVDTFARYEAANIYQACDEI